MADEHEAQFVPRRPVQQPGRDAEIETDIDEDGADRAAADLGFDFLLRGQAVEGGGLGLGWFGGARLAWGAGAEWRGLQVAAARGAAAEPGFERGGAKQPTGDAGEDAREIGGAEDPGEEGEAGRQMRGGGVLLEAVGEGLAVGDEGVDEAEDARDLRW